jgi:hypothetical protein
VLGQKARKKECSFPNFGHPKKQIYFFLHSSSQRNLRQLPKTTIHPGKSVFPVSPSLNFAPKAIIHFPRIYPILASGRVGRRNRTFPDAAVIVAIRIETWFEISRQTRFFIFRETGSKCDLHAEV